MSALRHVFQPEFHVVAQIVESQFVICRVGDICRIGLLARIVVEVGDDHTGRQTEEAIDLPHPLRITPGKVVIDGDDMHAAACQGVQIDRHRRDEGLTLTGFHLSDLAPVKHDAANQLHIERTQANRTFCSLTNRGECLWQQVIQAFTTLVARLVFICLGFQIFVRQRHKRILMTIDLIDDFLNALNDTVVGRAEYFFRDRTEAEHRMSLPCPPTLDCACSPGRAEFI